MPTINVLSKNKKYIIFSSENLKCLKLSKICILNGRVFLTAFAIFMYDVVKGVQTVTRGVR